MLIGGTIAIHLATGMSFPALTRDPASTMELPAYTGFLSNASVLLWAAAAAVGLFSAALLPRGHARRGFLALAGGIALVFGLDDVYMFHEYIAPALLGVPEKVVYLLYAMIVLRLVWLGRRLGPHDGYLLFVVALAGLGLSVGIDVLDSRGWFPVEDPYLLEDGCKVTGVVFWLGYSVLLARSTLRATSDRPARTSRSTPA